MLYITGTNCVCANSGLQLTFDLEQKQVEDNQPVQLRQPGRPKGSRDAQPRLRRHGQALRRVGSVIKGNCQGPILNVTSGGMEDFKVEDVESVYDKTRTHNDADFAIDGFAAEEAATVEYFSECSWAGTGVDVSGGDDPFHADWPFWK